MPAFLAAINPIISRQQNLIRIALALVFACVLSACGIPLGGKNASRLQGLIPDQSLNEISGLTASTIHKDVYWVHNDGGNNAQIYAINSYGKRLATLTIDDVTKTDWEDIDHYSAGGKHYLVIADTGDNGALRKTLQLHVIEEPAALSNQRVKPVRSIAFKFPDGPHDTEAIAVDGADNQVLIITKRRKPPLVFSVPLNATSSHIQTATKLGEVTGVPVATAEELKARRRLAPYDHQVTAADIAPDRREISVMTYRYLLRYHRARNQTWAQALQGKPTERVLPVIPQAEAMGYTQDGKSVLATGEFSVAPLYRIPVHP